jgi:hypothetical protein
MVKRPGTIHGLILEIDHSNLPVLRKYMWSLSLLRLGLSPLDRQFFITGHVAFKKPYIAVFANTLRVSSLVDPSLKK